MCIYTYIYIWEVTSAKCFMNNLYEASFLEKGPPLMMKPIPTLIALPRLVAGFEFSLRASRLKAQGFQPAKSEKGTDAGSDSEKHLGTEKGPYFLQISRWESGVVASKRTQKVSINRTKMNNVRAQICEGGKSQWSDEYESERSILCPAITGFSYGYVSRVATPKDM